MDRNYQKSKLKGKNLWNIVRVFFTTAKNKHFYLRVNFDNFRKFGGGSMIYN